MKRIEALAPLSRDHHNSLILAQLLKKGAPKYKELPTQLEEKRDYALQHFEEHIKSHFIQEEIVLKSVKHIDSSINLICIEIFDEHKKLHQLFSSLKNSVDIENALDEIGILLEAHIRKEERILFPILQEKCSTDELNRIHQQLH
ncbi:MAG: hypothetical protein KGZ59_06165 [Chitinophagaceae bacterium]|nr:hypothetical protein [Chitinophagaceae bacterium]